MVRVGGFLKTHNRIRRQRARGRFISPYQVGGTIFGKSTRMHNNPLRFPSSSPENEMLERWLKQRMKGGNVFSKLKKRIQIDFPHRPFPAAHPIHDWYRMRKGIKRGRR